MATAFLSVLLGSVRHSWAYDAGLEFARESPSVVQALGKPITAGWRVQGMIDAPGVGSQAWLTIPLHGPGGSGTLYVEASRFENGWRLTRAEFSGNDDDEWIDLIEERNVMIFVRNATVAHRDGAAARRRGGATLRVSRNAV